MSNGEIAEGSSIEEGTDYAAIALRKKIRNKAKDRYSDHNELKDLTEISGMKFGESWYSANYNLGKIKVETTSGSAVTLKNTEDGRNGTKATVSDSKVLGQDADYIYRTVKVTIESNDVISKVDTIDVNSGDAFDTSENDGKTVSFLALQKISKEQAEDKIDGASYAKTAVTYILSVSLLDNADITVAGGYIVEYIKESGTITIQTISLYEEQNNQNYVYANNVESEEIGYMDIDSNGDMWKIEDGFVCKFDNYSEWDKVYRVDKGMNRLSVYDDSHMIIWSDDSNIYSIKADNPEETNSEGAVSEVTTSQQVVPQGTLGSRFGWITNANGSKSYINEEGTKSLGWLYNTSAWYYFNPFGIMQTGWIKDNDNWYYLSESGDMRTGWLEENGKWYFLNTSGEMLHNATVDGYELGSDGEWIQ